FLSHPGVGAGRDRVDLNAAAHSLDRQVLGQPPDGGFGRTVAGQVGYFTKYGLGSRVHDTAVTSREEMRPGGSSREERPEVVDIDHPTELFGGELFESVLVGNARVVYHHVDTTEGIESGSYDDRCASFFSH